MRGERTDPIRSVEEALRPHRAKHHELGRQIKYRRLHIGRRVSAPR